MEFKSTVKFDETSFGRLRNRVKDIFVTERELNKNPLYAAAIPLEVDIQLTYACNLRCKMCYQWNDDGYFHSYNKELQNKELDIEIFRKILRETEDVKSRLYLWGGEPLYHTQWPEIANALEADRRYTTICTNGLLMEKNLDSILKISPDLALLFSIDGLHEANDALRGKKTFERVIKQMNLILEEQRKGNYKGTVSVNVVLNDGLIPQLYEFVEYFENLGIDSIYFNFPWYISEERASAMDEFFHTHLGWLEEANPVETGSWRSYTYKISPESEAILKEQIARLRSRLWNIRVRFQQHLEADEISNFILDTYEPHRKCLALSNRMEVLANGKVGTCSKFFPELAIGNLNNQSLVEIWQSESFYQLRKVVSAGLLPVCAKCILLYRNGI